MPTEPTFRVTDLVQIAIGSCVMAFPAATTEEVWNLGVELSLLRVSLFAAASVFFLAVFIYVLHGHDRFPPTRKEFISRVFSTYGVTLAISAMLLFGLDRLDFDDPLVGLKRTLLVAFPASFAATVIDSLPFTRSNDSR